MKRAELWKDIRQTKETIDNALNNFDQVTDPALIDYYSYTLKAAGIRYQFLLKQAKRLNLSVPE
ncbi:MAG: YaaL family protein [Lachnospiraceae bacterium]|nr:YaaL family protein [Lachnospiraceae bacterium]